MKIIRALKLKKLINEYTANPAICDRNDYIHTHFKAIYSARVFGYSIIRNIKLWNKFIEKL